eukprot:scaffold16284_cov56-Phaeocystis_antarctica.AAC.4
MSVVPVVIGCACPRVGHRPPSAQASGTGQTPRQQSEGYTYSADERRFGFLVYQARARPPISRELPHSPPPAASTTSWVASTVKPTAAPSASTSRSASRGALPPRDLKATPPPPPKIAPAAAPPLFRPAAPSRRRGRDRARAGSARAGQAAMPQPLESTDLPATRGGSRR